jgi:phosphoribosylformylglycinamidine cyclo-ligase
VSDAYEKAGVDYDVLDRGKRLAIAEALATSSQLARHGASADDGSRGEPAFLFHIDGNAYGFVLECLGTKSVLARRYQEESGEELFSNVAYDAVAAIVNDLICVGALPLVINAYFSTGSAGWYSDEGRFASLVSGWRTACEDSQATWGGGESPSLSGLVAEDDIELAGSAVGRVPPGVAPVSGSELTAGDEIILVASTGLHANGASLVRMVADSLPEGLLTPLASGRHFGAAALDASAIYVGLVRQLLEAKVPVTYLSHITGHGMRKLMRANHELTYRIDTLPEVPEVLAFLADALEMDRRAAYGTFNMGAGFAVYVKRGAADQVVKAARSVGLHAQRAGMVEAGPRQIILEPLDITYSSDELSLR